MSVALVRLVRMGSRRFKQACADREAWGERKGYDGWKKHPAEIQAERMEEAIDIPVWGIGSKPHLFTRKQRLLDAIANGAAMVAWYALDRLRRSLM